MGEKAFSGFDRLHLKRERRECAFVRIDNNGTRLKFIYEKATALVGQTKECDKTLYTVSKANCISLRASVSVHTRDLRPVNR